MAQIFVYGDSFESVLVAICVPKFDFLKDYVSKNAKSLGIKVFVPFHNDSNIKLV